LWVSLLIADRSRGTINPPGCLTHRFSFVKDRVMMKSARRGFTLVELIVVIVIIATLIAVVMAKHPVPREKRRRAACVNNLKQIGLAFQMYATDWNGMYPPKKPVAASTGNQRLVRNDLLPDWEVIYPEYLGDLKPLFCPSDTRASRVYKEWQHRLKHGGNPRVAIPYYTDASSYVYTGYVAYTADYGDFVAPADSQFIGLFHAIYTLGWEDFDSDITFSEGQLEEYVQYTTGHSGNIYRMREGIGKLLVADVSDTASAATAESRCAVMWDHLFFRSGPYPKGNHFPLGCNVLFLDGHVEFISYSLGEFPVTSAVAAHLSRDSPVRPRTGNSG